MGGSALRWCFLALVALAAIIVPFVLYEERITTSVEGIAQGGMGRPLAAITILLLLASDVIAPVPSSLVATASGMLLGLVPGTAVTWTGMQAGAMLGYGLGRTAGASAATRLVGGSELARASRSHQRWGGYSLIVSRAVPVLAETSVLLAGTVRMPLARFVPLTAASNAAIALVYAGVGSYALETRAFLLAFAASVLVPALLMWGNRTLGSRGGSHHGTERGLRQRGIGTE